MSKKESAKPATKKSTPKSKVETTAKEVLASANALEESVKAEKEETPSPEKIKETKDKIKKIHEDVIDDSPLIFVTGGEIESSGNAIQDAILSLGHDYASRLYSSGKTEEEIIEKIGQVFSEDIIEVEKDKVEATKEMTKKFISEGEKFDNGLNDDDLIIRNRRLEKKLRESEKQMALDKSSSKTKLDYDGVVLKFNNAQKINSELRKEVASLREQLEKNNLKNKVE